MQELHVPVMKPAAYDTWEIREPLAAADLDTPRTEIEFPEQYLVVGAHTSVIATTNETDLVIPTADDILVLMDVDNQRRYTNTESVGLTSVAQRGMQFVTLSALDTQFRDLHMELKSPRPVLGLTFRWKIFDDATREALYQDCIVAVSFFCTPVKGI